MRSFTAATASMAIGNGDFGDNHVRFALLSKAALEISRLLFQGRHLSLPRLAGRPGSGLPEDIAGGWIRISSHTRTVTTIHNLGYQGIFQPAQMSDISLPAWLYRPDLLEFWGNISLLKAGLVFSDALTTVSRKYAEEIQTPEYGFGMDGLLRARRASLTGIVNGVDYARWDPRIDPAIPVQYSACGPERETGLQA